MPPTLFRSAKALAFVLGTSMILTAFSSGFDSKAPVLLGLASPTASDPLGRSCKPLPPVSVRIEADDGTQAAWSLTVRNTGPSTQGIVSMGTGVGDGIESQRAIWEGELLEGEERTFHVAYQPNALGDCVIATVEWRSAQGDLLHHFDAEPANARNNPKGQRNRDGITSAGGEAILQFFGSKEETR